MEKMLEQALAEENVSTFCILSMTFLIDVVWDLVSPPWYANSRDMLSWAFLF